MNGKSLINFGFVSTILFIIACIFLGFGKVCEPEIACKTNFRIFIESPPNEKGDALAGIAGSLAFLWIIITVLLQGKELTLQREELERTRVTLEKQTKFLENQDFTRNIEKADRLIRSKLNTLTETLNKNYFSEFKIKCNDVSEQEKAVTWLTKKSVELDSSIDKFIKAYQSFSINMQQFSSDGWCISSNYQKPEKWVQIRQLCKEILELSENGSDAVREEILIQKQIGELESAVQIALTHPIWTKPKGGE